MTAVDGPDPADIMYETVRAAVATIVEAIPADLRAEMLTRAFRDLGTELGDHGLLPTGDTAVEHQCAACRCHHPGTHGGRRKRGPMRRGAPRASLPDGTVEFGVQFNGDPATIITAPSREEAETSLAFNLRDSRSKNKAIAACFPTPVLVTRVGDGSWVPAEPTTGEAGRG